jgi:hypothetical protein
VGRCECKERVGKAYMLCPGVRHLPTENNFRSLRVAAVCSVANRPFNEGWLRAGRSGDRIPVGARFSALIQTDLGAQPASYTMATGSLPRVKRLGRDVDYPPSSSAEVKERVELYFYSPLWAFVACSGRPLPLPLA